MGSCQVRQPALFYKTIPKEEEDQFWINRIQLNYFRKRVKQLENQMWAQFKKLERQKMNIVNDQIKKVEQQFKQKLEDFKKNNPKKVKQLHHQEQSLEEYAGWAQTKLSIEQLKLQTEHRIQTIKDQLRSKFKKFFGFIETDLLNKYKHLILSRYLDQQTVEGIFQQWKSKNKDKIDKAKNDIQEQIKKRVTNERHYQMRWSTVVDEDLFVKVAESKPFERNIVDEGADKGIAICGFGCSMFR